MADIDWTKPIETTGKNPCVYLGPQDGINGKYWVSVWCPSRIGGIPWCVFSVDSDGAFDYGAHTCRIRNVPEKRRLEGWCNIYPHSVSTVFQDRENAELGCSPGRIACVRIDQEYVVGEGLE